jgi:hypothetical protein
VAAITAAARHFSLIQSWFTRQKSGLHTQVKVSYVKSVTLKLSLRSHHHKTLKGGVNKKGGAKPGKQPRQRYIKAV